ncbi:MAG: T9SS C-terminal target domain-containing protein [Calditrichaeota bacterium]|nr:MAG: T9SS C-terminal target domain-containing protein [Calditrichota bacterium]
MKKLPLIALLAIFTSSFAKETLAENFFETNGTNLENANFSTKNSDFAINFGSNSITFQKKESDQRLILEFSNSNKNSKIQGLEKKSEGFAKVVYSEIYNGTDLFYYFNENQKLKYDFVIKPGYEPSQILLSYNGASSLALSENGDLVVNSTIGKIIEQKPYTFQFVDGERVEIESSFKILNHNTFSFQIGKYNQSKTLYIDPVVEFSTFLGGLEDERGFGVKIDQSGEPYTIAKTQSSNYPTTSGVVGNSISGAADACVSKLTSDGSSLMFSTFIGGTDNDEGYSLELGANGSIWITGYSTSSDFPTSANGFDTIQNGSQDIFLTQLDSTCSSIIFSSYLGGSFQDIGRAMEIDAENNVFLTGMTFSQNFPVTAGVVDGSLAGGHDVFVTKIDTTILFATYIGGSIVEKGNDIAYQESDDEIYLIGETASTDFPISGTAFGAFFNGGTLDAYVLKLSGDGTNLVYSTYLGGASDDVGNGITLGEFGTAFVCGSTRSPFFPTTIDAFDQTLNNSGSTTPGTDAFICQINADASYLIFSTFLGTDSSESAKNIILDDEGAIWVGGIANVTELVSPNFSKGGNGIMHGNTDLFAGKISPDATDLIYYELFGGQDLDGIDFGNPIDLLNDSLFVFGTAESIDFPTTPNSFSPMHNGGHGDLVLIKLDVSDLPTSVKESNSNLPKGFSLAQNYPNPFNPKTTINYELPIKNSNSAKLSIFNTLGETVREFALSQKSGSIAWNGTDKFGKQVSSGVYFYKLQAGKFSQTRKMLLLK